MVLVKIKQLSKSSTETRFRNARSFPAESRHMSLEALGNSSDLSRSDNKVPDLVMKKVKFTSELIRINWSSCVARGWVQIIPSACYCLDIPILCAIHLHRPAQNLCIYLLSWSRIWESFESERNTGHKTNPFQSRRAVGLHQNSNSPKEPKFSRAKNANLKDAVMIFNTIKGSVSKMIIDLMHHVARPANMSNSDCGIDFARCLEFEFRAYFIDITEQYCTRQLLSQKACLPLTTQFTRRERTPPLTSVP